MMSSVVGKGYIIGLVGLVFSGISTMTFLANEALMGEVTAVDHSAGMMINNVRFKFMDTVSPHIGSFYFWVPFYCFVVLLLIGFDRVKFQRNFFFIAAYLGIAGVFVFMLNLILSSLLVVHPFRYRYGIPAMMDSSFICVHATLTFGSAIFAMLYLNKRFTIIKVSLLIFSLVVIYNLIYSGDDLPGNLLLGMIAGLSVAAVCNYWFKHLGAENPHHYRNLNTGA